MNAFTRQLAILLLCTALVNFGFFFTNQSYDCDNATTSSTTKIAKLESSWSVRNSSLDATASPLPNMNCNAVIKKVKRAKNSWQINELRRHLSLTDPSCLERNMNLFVRAFIPRIHLRQYNLHIPKTGGTSLCRLVRDNGLQAPPKLCRHRAYCPFWCNYCTTRKPMTCDMLTEMPYDFIGNERWMDHLEGDELFCNDFAYSITIREPVARAISNVNMWFGTCLGKRNFTQIQRTERLQVIQSNYMMWSLVGGSSLHPEGFHARSTHLELAKRMLMRFDFIMDVSSTICFTDIVEFMGFRKTEIPHARVAGGNYSNAYNWDNYRYLNELDTQLYEFALELIKRDCEFFTRVKTEYAKELPTLPPYQPPPPSDKLRPLGMHLEELRQQRGEGLNTRGFNFRNVGPDTEP